MQNISNPMQPYNSTLQPTNFLHIEINLRRSIPLSNTKVTLNAISATGRLIVSREPEPSIIILKEPASNILPVLLKVLDIGFSGAKVRAGGRPAGLANDEWLVLTGIGAGFLDGELEGGETFGRSLAFPVGKAVHGDNIDGWGEVSLDCNRKG